MSGSDPITSIGNLITTTIDKIFPDANQAMQAKAEFAKLRETNDFQVQLANLQINLADAQSKNWFQSAWRPALAWSCVATFIYHYLFFTIALNFYPSLKDIDAISFSAMMGVLMFLIGARSYDKSQNTDTK